MNCEEARLKIQALIDNELDEGEISQVLDHVQSCYRCRNEYIELLRLRKKMKNLAVPEPSSAWFESLQRKIGRKISSSAGQFLFIGSYLALAAYAVYSLLTDAGVALFIKIFVGGILAGTTLLLGVTIADRVRESRDDKYKGVMK